MLSNESNTNGSPNEDGVGKETENPAEVVWFLVGRPSEDAATRYFPVHKSPFCVGRRQTASLCLSSKTVSSLHAEFHDHGDSLVLSDLGSTNGTFVNGDRVIDAARLKPDDIVQFGEIPFRIMRQSASTNLDTVTVDVFDQAMSLVQFDKLMSERAVVPNYQPIVQIGDGTVVGYEVLARSPVVGLEYPVAMFTAAAQLNLQTKLSQMIRWKAVEQTRTIDKPPHLFVNTHPAELTERGLVESMRTLRELSSRQEITLEIHEAAVSDTNSMKQLRLAMRDLNIGLAFDDFGSGQARLTELSNVHPEYLKFDISLVQGIHEAPAERTGMIRTLVRMVRDLGAIPLAQGVECDGEREMCRELGFELAQGYLFGRPTPI